MLPVQTVMIRYMVLVYRWGRGRADVVGDWGGFAGGFVGGCCDGRMRSPVGKRREAVATGPGRAKAPPTKGRRGFLAMSTVRQGS